MEDPSIRLAARLTVSAAFLATLLGTAFSQAPIHPLPPAHVFGRYATKPPQASSSVASVVKAEHVDPIVITPARPIVAPNTGSHEDWLRAVGIPQSDWQYVDFILTHESGWRVNATEPTTHAYGLCQSLPASKMASAGADWLINPVTQLRWCHSYALGRYGSWANAYAWWQSHRWW